MPFEPQRRSLTLRTITTIMGLIALAFVLVVVGFVAWNEHRTLSREARSHAQSAALYLADHANRLFEVSDVALRLAALTIGDKDWATIEASQPIWTSLHETVSFSPYVDDIWLNDADGRLRLTSFAFPAPFSDASSRAIFQRIKAGDKSLLVGERVVGKLTKKATFLVARRLDNANGSFRGMVSATLDLSYFPAYWSGLDLANDERIAFVRAEQGDVLTSYQMPGRPTRDELDSSAFLSAIAKAPSKGDFERTPGLSTFYHQIGAMPLYVTVEFDQSSVARAWSAWMARVLPLAVLVFVMLLAMMVTGFRQARRESRSARELEAARDALAEVNQSLERRVSERTADLQESNEEIQRFAYIVSHDLRAPLVNIMGFTSELQALRPKLFSPPGADGASPEEKGGPIQRDFDEAIGFIGASTTKMDRLIKAILTLSRQGKRKFQPETIELTAFLRSIVDGLAHHAQRAGACVTITPLPTIQSDRIALDQIFANLIDNAIKYLQPGVRGEVQVTGERIGHGVTIHVRDNGRGIDPQDHERVFDLFRRAGAQDQPGEGIGLAHVRSIVRRLGGTIDLDSAKGQGSVFTVHLPDMLQDHRTSEP